MKNIIIVATIAILLPNIVVSDENIANNALGKCWGQCIVYSSNGTVINSDRIIGAIHIAKTRDELYRAIVKAVATTTVMFEDEIEFIPKATAIAAADPSTIPIVEEYQKFVDLPTPINVCLEDCGSPKSLKNTMMAAFEVPEAIIAV